MTIELEPELAARLKRAAEEMGTDEAAYLARLVENGLKAPQGQEAPSEDALPPDEWIRRCDAWVAGNDWPALPAEAYDRESFYGESR